MNFVCPNRNLFVSLPAPKCRQSRFSVGNSSVYHWDLGDFASQRRELAAFHIQRPSRICKALGVNDGQTLCREPRHVPFGNGSTQEADGSRGYASRIGTTGRAGTKS
jgi:hypothetical protein